MKVVHRIGDFNGVTHGTPSEPADAEKLEQKEITTIADLWRCVGVDFDAGIDVVAKKAIVDPELVYALLIADCLGDSRHTVEAPPLSPRKFPKRIWIAIKRLWYARERHWLEALLVVATLLLVALAIRTGYVRPKIVEQVVVSPSTRLVPFEGIRAKDVVLKNQPAEKGTFISVEKIVGRFPLTMLPPGTTLREEQLVPDDLTATFRDRRTIAIPVNPRTLSPTLAPPTEVWLLLSARVTGEKAPPPVLLKDVILLSINRESDAGSIVVAVTDDGLKELVPVLGASEVFLLQPAK